MYPIEAAPNLGFLGSRIRWIEKMTSSGVTVLPLWNSTPDRSVATQALALPCWGSSDVAIIISSGPKSGGRTASGSYRFQTRMMSGSAVGRWASMVSLAPPPVEPTEMAPPVLGVPVLAPLPAGALVAALEELLLLPQAASSAPALSIAPPVMAPRITCRRGRAPTTTSRVV